LRTTDAPAGGGRYLPRQPDEAMTTASDLTAEAETALAAGLAGLGLASESGLARRLLAYVALLQRWNSAYNLTGARQPVDIVHRHVLDSLAVRPYLRGRRILDVGSGAGLPGLVLAMACPGSRFVLLDSAGKKCRFMRHVVAKLGLPNVEVVEVRVESYAPASGFDTVISRAFASLADFVRLAGHLAGPRGRLLAMKGRLAAAELADVPAGWSVARTHALKVPGLDEARHLVELARTTDVLEA
jgi:16S rRNA (guanine527-N7)-methyltransferase